MVDFVVRGWGALEIPGFRRGEQTVDNDFRDSKFSSPAGLPQSAAVLPPAWLGIANIVLPAA